MYLNDPHLMNDNVDANQPTIFGFAGSFNSFNYILDRPSDVEEPAVDEDDRYFGTHIIEAKRIIKNVLKKK